MSDIENEPLSSEDLITRARDSMKSSIPDAPQSDFDADMTLDSSGAAVPQHSDETQDTHFSEPAEFDEPLQSSDPWQPPSSEQTPTAWGQPAAETATPAATPERGNPTDSITRPADRIGTTSPRRSRLRVLRPLLIIGGIGAFLGVSSFFGSTPVSDIRAGDCFDALDGAEEIFEIKTFSCSEPHMYEVMHIFNYTDDSAAPYPGEAIVWEEAVLGCIEEFTNFTGLIWEEEVDVFLDALYPVRAGWEDENDREAICMLVRGDADGNIIQTTGTIRADT